MDVVAVRNPIQHLRSENHRLQERVDELQTQVDTLREAIIALCTLQDVLKTIQPNTDVMALMDHVLHTALKSIGASDGSILLVDEEHQELYFAVVEGQVRNKLQGHRIPAGTGLAGWVVKNNKPIIVPNVNTDPRFYAAIDKNFQFKTRSLICVPLSYEGRMLGVLQAINKTGEREFNDDDLTLLNLVALLAAIALAKADAILE